MNITDFTDALAEILHYVDLTSLMPSDVQPVSEEIALAESVAVDRGYVDDCGLTDKGLGWMLGWVSK